MTPEEIQLLLKATDFAARAHGSQRRKGARALPYVNHCIAVSHLLASVGGVTGAPILCAGLLHDTVEDTPTTAADVRRLFGAEIADLVAEVTDDRSRSRLDRKRLQIEHAPHLSVGASLIKMSDKICNVRDLIDDPPPSWGEARQLAYVDWAERVVAGFLHRNAALDALFAEVCAGARRR